MTALVLNRRAQSCEAQLRRSRIESLGVGQDLAGLDTTVDTVRPWMQNAVSSKAEDAGTGAVGHCGHWSGFTFLDILLG